MLMSERFLDLSSTIFEFRRGEVLRVAERFLGGVWLVAAFVAEGLSEVLIWLVLRIAKSLLSEAVEGCLIAERFSAIWGFECRFLEAMLISEIRIAEGLLGIMLIAGFEVLLEAIKAVLKFCRFRLVIHHWFVSRLGVVRWHHRMMRQFSFCDETLLMVIDDVGDVSYFLLLSFFDNPCLLSCSLMLGHGGDSSVELVLRLLFGDLIMLLGGGDHPLLGDLLYNLGLMFAVSWYLTLAAASSRSMIFC